MILAFFSFAGLGIVSLRAHIALYFDYEPAVRQNIVVYGKVAKNEANVIPYFFLSLRHSILTQLSHCEVLSRAGSLNIGPAFTGSKK